MSFDANLQQPNNAARLPKLQLLKKIRRREESRALSCNSVGFST
jgi:hypothetical protein